MEVLPATFLNFQFKYLEIIRIRKYNQELYPSTHIEVFKGNYLYKDGDRQSENDRC